MITKILALSLVVSYSAILSSTIKENAITEDTKHYTKFIVKLFEGKICKFPEIVVYVDMYYNAFNFRISLFIYFI